MNQFTILDTAIPDLKLIERKFNCDSRGFLARIFCADQLNAVGWKKPIAQINQTLTNKVGTVRGMHFQYPPHAEMKLVSCLQGMIWDVAIDLRKNSPTFLKWHAESLSPENGRSLLIPEGFAHGFQALTDNCQLLYLHSSPYVLTSEAGIRPNDPFLKILWPLNFSDISSRDSQHPLLNESFKGVDV